MTKKSDEKKVTKKTRTQYDMILSSMEPGEWYRTNDFIDILGVKEGRTKTLLRELVAARLLEDDGATKGKRYRKI